MVPPDKRSWKTPRDNNLGLHRIENRAGLSISVLPNGCIFAIEHRREDGTTMINQLLGAPVDGGIARLYLRIGGAASAEAAGPGARGQFAAAGDRFVWEGETNGLRHRATLSPHPRDAAWLWCLEATNIGEAARTIDAILIQDIGLGDRGFLMTNEAYASQYIDHHIGRHPRYGPVVMSRQNLPQGGRNPWVVHGCLDGASGFATDGMQLFGPAFRDRDAFPFPFGTSLPSERLQHELACAAIQSSPASLPPGARGEWRFFGLYDQNHAEASNDRDLARIDAVAWHDRGPHDIELTAPVRSLVQDAPSAASRTRSTLTASRNATRTGSTRSERTKTSSPSSPPIRRTTAMSCSGTRSGSSRAATAPCCVPAN